MSEIVTNFPWLVVLLVFSGMAALQWRLIHALDQALARLSPGQPSPPVSVPGKAAPIPPAEKPASAPSPESPEGPPVDEALVAAVKEFEGFSAKAYGDYKQYSIGYGTKASSPNEVIDKPEADRRLRAELAVAARSVEAFAPNAPKGVKQALIDLTYNAGPIWQRGELGKLVQAGSYEDAKAHVLQYNHAGGQVNEGLTRRRHAEITWFDHPL